MKSKDNTLIIIRLSDLYHKIVNSFFKDNGYLSIMEFDIYLDMRDYFCQCLKIFQKREFHQR